MAGSDSSFLGRGWSFPPTFDKTLAPSGSLTQRSMGLAAGVQMAEGREDVEQSIRLILSTSPGERTMLPDFGCPVGDFLFKRIDTTTETMLRDEVSSALLHYEPRIFVNAVAISAGHVEEGRIDLSIDYTIRGTNSRANMVYPYCAAEGTLLNPP